MVTLVSAIFCALPIIASAQSVTLNVEGTLAASCELRDLPSGVQSLGDLAVAGSKIVNFTVDCNAPFAYALTSANLGLTYDANQVTTVPGSQSFDTLVPYAVTTEFQTDGATFGNTNLTASSLTSANAAPCVGATFLPTCPFANSGTNAAATGKPAKLTLNWNGTGSNPLLAGTYKDTLTLTVRVK